MAIQCIMGIQISTTSLVSYGDFSIGYDVRIGI